MKPRPPPRRARRVSGPRSCCRSKRHLRHADKVSLRRIWSDATGKVCEAGPNNLQGVNGGVLQRDRRGGRGGQRLLGKGGVAVD